MQRRVSCLYHVVMSAGRDELKTLSFAFEACISNKTDVRD
jgi:hypothetical protein